MNRSGIYLFVCIKPNVFMDNIENGSPIAFILCKKGGA